MQRAKRTIAIIVLLLFSFLVPLASAGWTIGDFEISDDWTIAEDWGGDSYNLTLVIGDPKNQTYTTSSVPVNLNSFGNDTNRVYSWNFMFSNGSWLYAVNHTTLSETMSIMGNATGKFCAVVSGDHTSDYGEVYLSVSIILADSYTINLVISSPIAQTYMTQTISVSLSTTGNDTVSSYSWNFLKDGATWLFAANQTAASQTVSLSGNGTYLFCCYVAGEHLSSDYGEVEFLGYYTTTTVILPTGSTEETPENTGPDVMPVILLGVIIGTVAVAFAVKMERD